VTIVQRHPAGLLEVLGMKGLGTVPGRLSDTYAPTLETLQMIARGTMQHRTASTPAAGLGAVATVTVPPNETWILMAADARQAGTASHTALGIGVLISVGPATAMAVADRIFTMPLIVANYDCPFVPPHPWILQAGDAISAVTRQSAGNTSTLTIQALVGVIGS
jgi:hypothetical protein